MARATGLSRRAADKAIMSRRVQIDAKTAALGDLVHEQSMVTLDDRHIIASKDFVTILLNKPPGYVCSRIGQGAKTIYDLLPKEYHDLKPVGRLDKASSGLLLLTNDGLLAHQLTHPSYQKQKVYEVALNKPLDHSDKLKIEKGILLEDGPSKLALKGSGKNWQVTMSEGRNRQIRRTFSKLKYKVTKLHRVQLGNYHLNNLPSSDYKKV